MVVCVSSNEKNETIRWKLYRGLESGTLIWTGQVPDMSDFFNES